MGYQPNSPADQLKIKEMNIEPNLSLSTLPCSTSQFFIGNQNDSPETNIIKKPAI
jgi:hypothetical protein